MFPQSIEKVYRNRTKRTWFRLLSGTLLLCVVTVLSLNWILALTSYLVILEVSPEVL